MKLKIFILTTLLAFNNFLYGYDNANEFVEDCKLLIEGAKLANGVELAEGSMAKFIPALKANGYLKGFLDTRGLTIALVAARENGGEVSPNQWNEKLAEVENQIFKVNLPDKLGTIILAKVIVRYAEENPEKLTLEPLLFVLHAIADAWGHGK